MKKQTLLDRRYPFWLALPAVIIFSVFFILPIIMGTGLSMTNWDMELDRIDFVACATMSISSAINITGWLRKTP